MDIDNKHKKPVPQRPIIIIEELSARLKTAFSPASGVEDSSANYEEEEARKPVAWQSLFMFVRNT